MTNMALYTRLNQIQITQLLKHFANLPQKKFKSQGIGMGTVNTYYKITYGPKQVYFLKIDEVGNEARLKNEIRIFENLIACKAALGFDFPVPLKTKSGLYYFRYGKKFVLLLTELPGKANFHHLTLKHLSVIGENMAKLNQARLFPAVKDHRFCLKGLKKAYGLIKGDLEKKHTSLSLFIRAKLLELEINYPKKIKTCLIHADLFPENIHWNNNKFVGILDYEAAGRGEALFDLCVGIHALCLTKKKLDRKKITALIKGYEKTRPLSKLERNFFDFFLQMTALRFLITRLKDFELVNADPNAENFKDFREYVVRFEELAHLDGTKLF